MTSFQSTQTKPQQPYSTKTRPSHGATFASRELFHKSGEGKFAIHHLLGILICCFKMTFTRNHAVDVLHAADAVRGCEMAWNGFRE